MGVHYNSRKIVTDGLVCYWDFKNPKCYPGSGDNFYNLSTAQGYSGEAIEGTSLSTSFVSFSASGDIARTDGTPEFGVNTTWEAKVRIHESVNAYNMFMGRHLPYFAMRSNGQLHISNIISSQRNVLSTGFSWQANVWYHFCFTTSFSDPNTTMSMYINGAFNNSDSWSGSQGNYGTSYRFGLGDGRGNTVPWYPFRGDIEFVRIYDRTLSQEEITHNYELSM